MPRTRAKKNIGSDLGHIDVGVDGLSVRIDKYQKGLIGALIDLETDSHLATVIGVMARFTYDGDQKLAQSVALKAYREFSIDDMEKLTASFQKTVKAIRNQAAPPPNSGG